VGQSLFETKVSIKILTGVGKTHLQQRDFVNAEKSLKSALLQYEDGSRLGLDVLATLSDTHSELKRPSQALTVLRSNGIPQTIRLDRYYTNCYISYAQALVCLHEVEEADYILLKLKERFRSDSHLDRHDRRNYIRVVLLFAQNLHFRPESLQQWEETVGRWTVVIHSTSDFDEVSCWDRGMIYLSMHHAILQSRKTDGDWLMRGTSELQRDGQFWMRGMTTYWHDFLLPKLPRVDGIERLFPHADVG
jgi:hypothetical protein